MLNYWVIFRKSKDMLLKKDVLKTLKELPDEFSVDEAIDRLILLHKIKKARNEISSGKGVSTEQAKKKLKKWLN
jgi:pantothenate kinase